MHQIKYGSLYACVIVFFMLCFILAGSLHNPAFDLHFSNRSDEVPEIPESHNSLLASSLPKAYFLPDERNFVSDRPENFVLNYYHVTFFVTVVLVSLLSVSKILYKHSKRLFKLQI